LLAHAIRMGWPVAIRRRGPILKAIFAALKQADSDTAGRLFFAMVRVFLAADRTSL